MTIHAGALISCLGVVVGRVNIIVSLHFIVVNIDSIGVRLRFWVVGIACDIVGCCGGPSPRLVGIAPSVWLSQVGHAARVGVHVFSVAPAHSAPVGVVVTRDAVFHTRLACVGGTVIEHFGAVAASS